MIADTYIVYNKALVFAFIADTVDTCNSLQEVVISYDSVQIHDLLDWRIETGDQHVHHNQNADITYYAFVFSIKRQFEALDMCFVS